MKIIFTIHAEHRLKKRKITKEEVIEAIKYSRITLKKSDKYYAKRNVGRGIIEVVYEKTENYIKVITAYWL